MLKVIIFLIGFNKSFEYHFPSTDNTRKKNIVACTLEAVTINQKLEWFFIIVVRNYGTFVDVVIQRTYLHIRCFQTPFENYRYVNRVSYFIPPEEA